MTYEFICRDIKTKEDAFKIVKVSAARFEYVKSEFEAIVEKLNKQNTFKDTFVLLINRCDDDGEFEEIVQ